MAQAEAKAIRGSAQPSAAMREVKAIEAKLRAGKPVPTTIPEERTLRAEHLRLLDRRRARPYQTTDVSVPGEAGPVRARVYRPTKAENAPMVLLIHGGGWAFGSIEEMEPTARHLAAESGAVVVSTSYRLAPENPFPAGLKDCEATLRWILAEGRKHGGDPSRLAIGGASAGGNLAAAVAMRAPPGTFKAQLLFYGVLGNSFETASYREFGDGRFGLSRDRMKMFFDIYVGKADAERSGDHADERRPDVRAAGLDLRRRMRRAARRLGAVLREATRACAAATSSSSPKASTTASSTASGTCRWRRR